LIILTYSEPSHSAPSSLEPQVTSQTPQLACKTNHVERFNCTLRQRVSRLVRATLSFSKKLSHHLGAIKYFICDYNLTKGAALPE
jgi:insertion element IS1 protein InsB